MTDGLKSERLNVRLFSLLWPSNVSGHISLPSMLIYQQFFSDLCLFQRCSVFYSKYFLCLEKYEGVKTSPIGDFLFIALQLFSE